MFIGDRVKFVGDKITHQCLLKLGYTEDSVYTVKYVGCVIFDNNPYEYLTFEDINDDDIYGGISTNCFELINNRKSRIENLDI